MRSRIIKIVILLLCLTAVGGFLFYDYQSAAPRVLSGADSPAGKLIIRVLDVGQGDAILIREPDGGDILIDGGPDNSVLEKLGQYLPLGDREIETVILTHPHSDHVTGLVAVLRRYQVDRVLMTGALHTAPDYLAFLNLIKEKNIPAKVIDQREAIDFGGGLKFDVLYPNESFVQKRVENLNNTSIAGQLTYASTTIMLMGDLEDEEKLSAAGLALKSDVLKVGHHGSNNANSRGFLAAVSPAYAVISVGAENRYGLPNFRALKYLADTGAKVWRTDQDGDVILASDGNSWSD